jgi:PAS domain S-box-containing protein
LWSTRQAFERSKKEIANMANPGKKKGTLGAAWSVSSRYGLAFVPVATALGLSRALTQFHQPQTFAAFALSAIALTFWYAGTAPGILAAVLSSIVRDYLFEPHTSTESRLLFDLVFLVFALLMTRVARVRNQLELRVAERTAELTTLNDDLKREIAKHNQVEAELRLSQAYLAEAQRLSHTGSWAWSPPPGDIRYWSDECFRVQGFDPKGGQPSFDEFLQSVHLDDQARIVGVIQTAVREKEEFEFDYRIILPSGEIRDARSFGHPVLDASGELIEYVGTIIDVTERKQAEKERERLREAQADLAHVSRMTTMGELTASLAHEVNQPITAAVNGASTCVRWLTRDEPDLGEAREAALGAIRNAKRAADIINRIRSIAKKGESKRQLADVNDLIGEMIALLRTEASRYAISIRANLEADLPKVLADPVQVQQVLMNLIMNGIDAMKDVDRTRELSIESRQADDRQLMISVSDTGVGLPPQQAKHIFDAFFTTKSHGLGMGLRISRSIVESHGGRLWAADNAPHGAKFSFTLPIPVDVPEESERPSDAHTNV